MIRSFCLMLMVLGLVGCNSGPTLAPVKGTVLLDGKPLAQGTLRLETPGVRPATARIEDGLIVEVTTFKPSDGAPVGTHKVAFWANETVAPAAPGGADLSYMSGKSLLPARYNDPETSGESLVVPAGGAVAEFKLSSK